HVTSESTSLLTALSSLLPRIPLGLTPLSFFFNATATTEIYTLSLHDALPISNGMPSGTANVSASSASAISASPPYARIAMTRSRSEEHTSELQSRSDLVCRLLLEKKKKKKTKKHYTQK